MKNRFDPERTRTNELCDGIMEKRWIFFKGNYHCIICCIGDILSVNFIQDSLEEYYSKPLYMHFVLLLSKQVIQMFMISFQKLF